MSAQVIDFPSRGRTGATERHLRLVPAPPASPRLRLTRRGRLVFSLLGALLAVVTVMTLGAALASASGEPRQITVTAGDTLSEIAAREMPQVGVAEGVVEIQLANALSTDQVHAGQHLVIPQP